MNISSSPPYDRGTLLRYFLIVASISFLAYLNSIPNEFIWDDIDIIKENPLIRDFSNLFKFFTTSWWGESSSIPNYRPLTVTSLLINYKVTGISAEGFRIVNILLHTVNSLLVLLLAMAVGIRGIFALTAAVVFAVHPIHTESVVWIVGRAELLACTFFLASLILNISTSKTRFTLISLALYFCALLSKESAITLPIIIFACQHLFVHKGGRKDIKASLISTAPYLALTLAYLILRVSIIGSMGEASFSFANLIGPYNLFLTMTRVVLHYWQLLFYPVVLRAHYHLSDFPVSGSIADPFVMVSIFIHMIIFTVAAFYYKRDKRITLSILWVYVTLALYMHIIPFQWLMAERFLYIPSIGFSLLLGSALMTGFGRIERTSIKKFVLTPLIIIFIAGLSVKTVSRNMVWKNEVVFFKEIIRYEPWLAIAHASLGNALLNENKIDEAISSYQQAANINPKYRETLNNLQKMNRKSK